MLLCCVVLCWLDCFSQTNRCSLKVSVCLHNSSSPFCLHLTSLCLHENSHQRPLVSYFSARWLPHRRAGGIHSTAAEALLSCVLSFGFTECMSFSSPCSSDKEGCYHSGWCYIHILMRRFFPQESLFAVIILLLDASCDVWILLFLFLCCSRTTAPVLYLNIQTHVACSSSGLPLTSAPPDWSIRLFCIENSHRLISG